MTQIQRLQKYKGIKNTKGTQTDDNTTHTGKQISVASQPPSGADRALLCPLQYSWTAGWLLLTLLSSPLFL